MKRTTVTLYAAETGLTASHVPVAIHGLPLPVYVRVEIGHLDNATPLDGETVLNSMEIGEDDEWPADAEDHSPDPFAHTSERETVI